MIFRSLRGSPLFRCPDFLIGSGTERRREKEVEVRGRPDLKDEGKTKNPLRVHVDGHRDRRPHPARGPVPPEGERCPRSRRVDEVHPLDSRSIVRSDDFMRTRGFVTPRDFIGT